MSNTAIFEKKIKELQEYIFDGITVQELGESINDRMPVTKTGEHIYSVFISVCNTKKRTAVLRNTGYTLDFAWEKAVNRAARFVEINDYEPVWVKADIMVDSERVDLQELERRLYAGSEQGFRRGIAFDDDLLTALLEAELNSGYLLSYRKRSLEIERINAYIKHWCGMELEALPEYVTLFDCRSYFHDGSEVHTLFDRGPSTGRRVTEELSKELIGESIKGVASYIKKNIGTGESHGCFRYGVLPMYHQELSGYSLLRHAGTSWSLLCAFKLTGDPEILKKVGYCIDYIMEHMINGPDKCIYLLDEVEKEVRLGPNALSLLVMSEYMHITRYKRYIEPATRLAMGILRMQKEDGSFVHILDSEDMSVKQEKFNNYYDGEVVFALARYYGLTGVKPFLQAAVRGADYMCREGYDKYRNHWTSYAMNEITRYRASKDYFELGIKNLQAAMAVSDTITTSSPAMVELLCAGIEMYKRISNGGRDYFIELTGFDIKKCTEILRKRTQLMMNGRMWPELAMYFMKPDVICSSFFVREDLFRIRIDDLQHACCACCMLYILADELDPLEDGEI